MRRVGRLNDIATSRLRVGRYDTAEVDAFREAIRDTFLGVSRSPLMIPTAWIVPISPGSAALSEQLGVALG